MALLAKREEALDMALWHGRENHVNRAIQILETTLTDVLQMLERMAEEEEWTLARWQEKIKEVREWCEIASYKALL